MATTTNFGWETPDDTDYVKDGAAAMRTLGSSIDSTMVDLKGGTTGQVLSKNTNTDMDFVWTTISGDITDVTAGTGLSGGGSSGNVTLSINTAVTADLTTAQTLTNKVLTSPEESANIVASAATGTINVDVNTAAIWYYTSNASANFTLNFRGNSGTTLSSRLAVGEAISVVFLNTNGTTAYYPNVFQIDGSAVTPKWAGGTAPAAGNASSVDSYSFTIIKTAATPTYLVLAGQTKFA